MVTIEELAIKGLYQKSLQEDNIFEVTPNLVVVREEDGRCYVYKYDQMDGPIEKVIEDSAETINEVDGLIERAEIALIEKMVDMTDENVFALPSNIAQVHTDYEGGSIAKPINISRRLDDDNDFVYDVEMEIKLDTSNEKFIYVDTIENCCEEVFKVIVTAIL